MFFTRSGYSRRRPVRLLDVALPGDLAGGCQCPGVVLVGRGNHRPRRGHEQRGHVEGLPVLHRCISGVAVPLAGVVGLVVFPVEAGIEPPAGAEVLHGGVAPVAAKAALQPEAAFRFAVIHTLRRIGQHCVGQIAGRPTADGREANPIGELGIGTVVAQLPGGRGEGTLPLAAAVGEHRHGAILDDLPMLVDEAELQIERLPGGHAGGVEGELHLRPRR